MERLQELLEVYHLLAWVFSRKPTIVESIQEILKDYDVVLPHLYNKCTTMPYHMFDLQEESFRIFRENTHVPYPDRFVFFVPKPKTP